MSCPRKDIRSKRLCCALAAAFFAVFAAGALLWVHEAQALRVSMKRIIFEGPKRSDIVTIINNTANEQTYRLGWKHYRMQEKKSLQAIPEEEKDKHGVKWADDMIRYAPRRVTVPPGGSQQIRLLLRRPRDLEPGEYRSHLWILTEAEAVDFMPDEGRAATGKRSFRLAMQPALTLPVFVRHGDVTAKASITGAGLSNMKEDGATISFAINREGNRSLYGDIRLTCIGGGGAFEAYFSRGTAVYPEVGKRSLEFDFRFPPEQAANCRRVRIEYIADRGDTQYKGEVMAQAVVAVQ